MVTAFLKVITLHDDLIQVMFVKYSKAVEDGSESLKGGNAHTVWLRMGRLLVGTQMLQTDICV